MSPRRAAVRREVSACLRMLRRDFPVRGRVAVFFEAPGGGDCAEVLHFEDRADLRQVLLAPALLAHPRLAVEALIHEWAHLRAEDAGEPASAPPHGPLWAAAYWPPYSAWFDFQPS